jgi:hypothetical protein
MASRAASTSAELGQVALGEVAIGADHGMSGMDLQNVLSAQHEPLATSLAIRRLVAAGLVELRDASGSFHNEHESYEICSVTEQGMAELDARFGSTDLVRRSAPPQGRGVSAPKPDYNYDEEPF